MKMRCITCHEIIGSVYWELESGYVACNNCYWKDYAEHLTPIIQKGTIKGPTKEDFNVEPVSIVVEASQVDKLQEQLNTAKKALTDIIFFSQGCYDSEYFASIAQKALKELEEG